MSTHTVSWLAAAVLSGSSFAAADSMPETKARSQPSTNHAISDGSFSTGPPARVVWLRAGVSISPAADWREGEELAPEALLSDVLLPPARSREHAWSGVSARAGAAMHAEA